ncbi:autophagy-related protein 2 isoform X10 [Vitis riparia]|uniref:autophagy-related protein 2 isoform X10 n=1 Tax=Vitis riparia TaxID=96939 RepID=UPI00155B1AD3|nr:autophagy-related protein 2 isoform X10 [Vitis riparia]
MFPWNFAKSAEEMFSQWAIKRVCKFLLKKKLGQFILGDVDLDQLDVQLSAGTIQLSDVALNVDYLNQKLGAAAAVVVKEGSIGSLSVKMPWKVNGFQIDVDELELVLGPCVENNPSSGDETSVHNQVGNHDISQDFRKFENEMVDNAATSASLDVHEGVKTIAKMVKWLLTSFHVKVRKLIVAFDPCSEKNEKKTGFQKALVLRIDETECGTCVSEDDNSNGDARVESFLGISRLTNFIKFQGAIIELLQIDDVDHQTSFPCTSGSFSELLSGFCPSNATTPILTGEGGGFSGTVKLSMPWKNGSLDIHKVDADVYIDPIELRFQPSTINWFLLLWESLKSLGRDGLDGKERIHHKTTESVSNLASYCHSSTLASAAVATDEVIPTCENFAADFCSTTGQESVTDILLPHLISDWVPFSVNDQKEEEVAFGASVDQFFECFDGVRSYQSALGNSGILNWTCSVFSAITAASSLASGSLYVPTEQQHVETNLKATIAGISVVFAFHDENQRHSCDLGGAQANVGLNVHYLGAECRDMLFILQVSPQNMKFEVTVKHIELADYFRDEKDVMDFALRGYNNTTLLVQHLQAEVQGALPPFALSAEDPDIEIHRSGSASFNENDVVKVMLLRTSGVSHCLSTVNSSSVNGSLAGTTSFSLKLPPIVFWVNFQTINALLDLSKEFENSLEMNCNRSGFPSEAFTVKYGSSQEDVKGGSGSFDTTLSSRKSLRGNIFLPNARVILCFPFETDENSGCYSSWDQFLVLDLSLPSSLDKGIIQDTCTIPNADSQNGFSSRASRSLHLNVGNLDIYLVTSSCEDGCEINSRDVQRHGFSAHRILSATNRTSSFSVISMLWQERPVTGPWIAKKAKLLVTSEDSRTRNKFVGKGYEFASVTTVKDLGDLNSCTRREMILSSAFFLHLRLSPITVNLSSSQYNDLHHLINQVTNGLSRVACDPVSVSEEASVTQMSILVECDSVEILINLDRVESIKGSLQSELPGSWHSLKLKIQKFELLSVSNIGGIKGAKFLWFAHGEGKLWGSITSAPEQELLLILCSNSTMKRGDGEGLNKLSSRLAGSDIIHLWDPESVHSYASITVRCSTVIAVGGRLDWLEAISSFFSLPSAETEQPGYNSSQNGDLSSSFGSSFYLNLVDIGLSYEPYFKHLLGSSDVLDSDSISSANYKEEVCERYVACMLAASSLNLSNTTMADSTDNEYKIRIQDLGLLVCAVSEPENVGGIYSSERLHKVGYVKVAGEALFEAILRTNCRNGLLWELECSESHIHLDTCHDTTSGLICLVSQIQRLFAPDVEESIIHLQTRWNNVQQAQERNDSSDETMIFNSDSAPPAAQVHTSSDDAKTEHGVFALMDEICEDAFNLGGHAASQLGSCESQIHISLDGSFLGEACNLNIRTPEFFSRNLSFNGTVPVIGLDSHQSSVPQNGGFPEFIESYYMSESSHLSEISAAKESSHEILEFKSRNMGNEDLERGNSGWYGDASLRIVENHIPEMSEQAGLRQSVKGKLPSTDHRRPDDLGKARGRVLLKNVNVRWKMFAGSDWNHPGKTGQPSANISGRDAATCLELALSGMDFQYDIFPDGEIFVSKLSLFIKDFHLYDNSRDAPWKLVLGYYHSKDHPRESSSKAFKLDLEAVRPDPSTPLEEYRLRIAVLPILLHLHQGQLDFLVSFFGGKNQSVDQSPSHCHGSDGTKLSSTKNSNFARHAISEEALLPYFQKFDIWPILVRVDYSPCRVDLAALSAGKYVELVNLVPWKGVELNLKHVHAVGVYGWSSVCETIIGEWLEDISQNQIHKLLQGLPTFRSLVAVSSGAAKFVSLPVKNYKKDRRLIKGMQRGTIAFLRSISLEAVGLGVHLAAGAHEILLQAEYILSNIPSSVPWPVENRIKANIRTNQPKDAQQGIQQAYESLSDGLGRSASALVQTPLKKYQRGAGAGSALATAVQAAPAAAIAPASGLARAVHCALLGVRNSLELEHKKESMEKYMGPAGVRNSLDPEHKKESMEKYLGPAGVRNSLDPEHKRESMEKNLGPAEPREQI